MVGQRGMGTMGMEGCCFRGCLLYSLALPKAGNREDGESPLRHWILWHIKKQKRAKSSREISGQGVLGIRFTLFSLSGSNLISGNCAKIINDNISAGFNLIWRHFSFQPFSRILSRTGSRSRNWSWSWKCLSPNTQKLISSYFSLFLKTHNGGMAGKLNRPP